MEIDSLEKFETIFRELYLNQSKETINNSRFDENNEVDNDSDNVSSLVDISFQKTSKLTW